MKKATICALMLICMGCAVAKPEGPIRLTVTHIQDHGYAKEVWARRGYMVYMAQCENLSDTVKVGTVFTAQPSGTDTCDCTFKRVR